MSASVFVELRANISEFQAKMGEARSEMTKLQKHGESTATQLGSFGKTALMGVAGAAVGVGALSVETADKQEIAQKQLENSLKAAGQSWDEVKGKVKSTGDEASKYGYTQQQVDQALTTGVNSTQNYGNAHDNLQVAIQLAAAKHIDLNTAMQTVDKAATGQTRALKQLGIDLPVSAGGALKVQQAQDALSKAQGNANAILAKSPDALNQASKAHAAYEAAVGKVEAAHKKLADSQNAGSQILDALKQRLSGQADAAADTFAGKLAAAKAQGENLMATIGQKLIPILEKLMATTEGVVKWLEKHQAVAKALGIIIGTILVVAVVAYAASMASAAVATIAATWPILLIIAAIALLAFGVYEIIKHWHQIIAWFHKMWDEIKKKFDEGIHAVLDFFKKLPGEIVDKLGDFVNTIFHALLKLDVWFANHVEIPAIKWFASLPGKAFNALGDLLGTIWKDLIKIDVWFATHVEIPAIKWFASLPGKAFNALGDLIGTAFSALLDIGHWLEQHVWNPIMNFFTGLPGRIGKAAGNLLSNIPGIGTLGKMLGFAEGGQPPVGVPSIVGENGPELFVPNSAGTIIPNGKFGFAGGGGAANIHLQIDGKTFAQLILPSLQTTVIQAQRSSSVPIFGTV